MTVREARPMLLAAASESGDDGGDTASTTSETGGRRYQRFAVVSVVVLVAVACVAAWVRTGPTRADSSTSGGLPVAEADEASQFFMQGGTGDINIRSSDLRPPSPLVPPKPEVWQQIKNAVFSQEGDGVGLATGDISACRAACDNNPDCKSFSSCLGGNPYVCHLKNKAVTGSEERVANQWCRSNFKSNQYWPRDPELLRPSTTPGHSFYMYRVQGPGDFYPPGNVNAASIGGVMWYLHNEVIKTCTGEGFLADQGELGDRKFKIDRIRRFKVTMKTPKPLRDQGMDFGVLQSFDSGETTGPHLASARYGVGTGWESTPEWDKYGFHIGCGKLGEWPHDDEMWSSGKSYPNCVWYSLPGPCPQMPYTTQTTQCEVAYPGGMCYSPTGQGNCTFHYEEAGYIMVDHLVGIEPTWHSRKEFCGKCNTEGGPWWGGGCGLDFWGTNIWTDVAGNARRVQEALKAFEDKYPSMPKESQMPPPSCDFKKAAYGFQ